tara:strand:+ start:104 stop:787 length:684 start_codon:yes stop_codon:yes gene_type:complete
MASFYIQERLNRLRVSIDSNKLELLNNYVTEVRKWSQVHNLTGTKSLEKLVDRLVLDSVLVGDHIDFLNNFSILDKISILDVGSGNGSPAVVWAIIKKNIHLRLIEKSRKKVAFLNHLIRNLGLNDQVEVLNHRIEDSSSYENLNLITCRAFMDIEAFLEITYRLASKDTHWLLMTTSKNSHELSNQFLEKRGIIRVSDMSGALAKLDNSYEKNFVNKKILLFKKAV